MRRLLTIIVVLLIVGSAVPALGKGVESPQLRDGFIYSYFSQVIVRWEYSLRYALSGEPYSVQLANFTLGELTKIRNEGEYYESVVVHSRVMDVLPPFYDFTENLLVLNRLILTFQESRDPAVARAITTTVSRMESDLRKIELMKLRNGTKVLTFNVDRVRSLLEKARKLASTVTSTENFTVWVSNDRPWIGQAVTISGYFPGNGSVSVVIEGANHSAVIPLKTEDGTFSTTYRFQNAGAYRVFATAKGETSNVITVLVTKIPAYFVLDDIYRGAIGENVTVKGVLMDAFGRALGNRTVYANGSPIQTKADGSFSFIITSKKAGKVRVTLTFEGDETHRGVSKTVTVEFSRYRLSVFLRGPSEAKKGEELRFEGTLSANLSVPLRVYLNGVPYSEVKAKNGRFNFTLRAEKEGTMKVFVEFEGNELYSAARSNIVTVEVRGRELPWARYVALLAIIIALGALYFTWGRNERTKEVTLGEAQEVEIEEPPEIPGEVEGAFEVLLDLIRKRFHLSRSLTPREVLQSLQNWEHREPLAKVIELHERKVYGGTGLSREEEEEFFEALRVLLGVLT